MSGAAAIDPETVRDQIRALLPPGDTEIDAEENLIALGLDSLQVMQLINQWRCAGAEVGFSELIERPTLTAWQQLLDAAPAPILVPERQPTQSPATPFDLTDVQHANWSARQDGRPLGGSADHLYLELDGGTLDPARLERAWRALLGHHPMLRAHFDQQGRQRIAAASGCAPLALYDLRALPPRDCERRLGVIREARSQRRLAVERGEVAGLALSLLPDGSSRVHVDLDRLVADIESLRILLRDLATFYTGQGAPPSSSAQWHFASYLKTLEARLAPRHAVDRDYWMTRARSLPDGPRLPLRQPPETLERPHFRRRHHRLDAAAWQRLGERAQARGLTPALVLATAYAEVLACWSATPGFTLNLPLLERHDDLPGTAEAVADFTRLLLLEVDCSTPVDFASRAARLQRRFHADMAHASYCGARVLRERTPPRDDGGRAVPVVFACHLGAPLLDDDTRAILGGLGQLRLQTARAWLNHQVHEQDDALLLAWEALEALFPDGVIEAMFNAYVDLIERLAHSETAWTEPFTPQLPEAQRRTRAEVNATALALRPRLLHGGLFATARRRPERPALIDGEQVIGYGELATEALCIAAWLRAEGLAPGDAVAISLPRGRAQIAAVFGVLAAGGCYVPIDIARPTTWRTRVIERAGAGLVLDPATIDRARAHPPLPAPLPRAPSSVAYVLFDPTAPDQPVGVEVSHLAAANTLDAINLRYGVGAGDRALAVSALDLDLSVYDLFGPSQVGAALVCVPETAAHDVAVWQALIARHRVTLWNSLPEQLDRLLERVEHAATPLGLRLALVSRGRIARDLATRIATASAGGCRMVALQGMCATAIWSSLFEPTPEPLADRDSIPYGRPLPNQCYRVVDAQGRDCPDWVPGELWIGGAGLANGYRGAAEHAVGRFVTAAGARWYRTGDRGRYRPDGLLERLGHAEQLAAPDTIGSALGASRATSESDTHQAAPPPGSADQTDAPRARGHGPSPMQRHPGHEAPGGGAMRRKRRAVPARSKESRQHP
ncbi:enantio-pyochelin synthetase E [Marichromatium purpuratum 984]|uniref:Enantio-pyochelin synthetase E n=1 Tax=Marichromatium purpuratum 984 TaxID=765910 RepID=W0E3Z0_MARPU|nr:AMP-binding protein [Marichromatium purpuratum]AHF03939.1 enantio-pyochelin synthetase E [Marichromatium purpuratum 984]